MDYCGHVIELFGKLQYIILLDDCRIWRRHLNQIRKIVLGVCLSPEVFFSNNELNNQPLPVLFEKNEKLDIEKKNRNHSELKPQSNRNDKILRRLNRYKKALTSFV